MKASGHISSVRDQLETALGDGQLVVGDADSNNRVISGDGFVFMVDGMNAGTGGLGEGRWRSDAKTRDVVLSFADWRENDGTSAGVPDPITVTSFKFHMYLSGEAKDLKMSFTTTDPDTFFTFAKAK